jgi:hypothetical protein
MKINETTPQDPHRTSGNRSEDLGPLAAETIRELMAERDAALDKLRRIRALVVTQGEDERQIREHIAADIEAMTRSLGNRGVVSAYHHAASIARGMPRP